MRKYIILFIVLFVANDMFAQVVKTVGVVYTASAPVHTPSGQGAWIAVDTTSGSWYEWERTTGVWRDAGYRIQLTNTTGAPSYTPSKARGRVALNSGDSLYAYQGGVWDCLNCVTASDTATYLLQDSILVYYANGIEFDRDTIDLGTVDLSGYLEWSDTTNFISTHQDLKDTANAIRNAIPAAGLTGNGVANYLPQYATASTLDTTGVIWTSTGRLGIGQAVPTARAHITGTGTTNLTTALLVENSAGTDIISANDAGGIYIQGSLQIGLGGGASIRNVVLSAESLANNSGTDNTAIGYRPLRYNTTGSENTAVGRDALMNNLGGSSNTAFGVYAMYANQSGGSNFGLGYYALGSNVSGSNNIAIGRQAVFSNTASDNVGVGNLALFGSVAGGQNTAIGTWAGRFIVAGTNNLISNNSIFVGYDSRPLASSETNTIVIAHSGRGLGSNTTRIGNTSTVQTHLDGKLTIGTNTTPAASAIADFVSTTSGFLPPRMTTAQRDAIASPATGLMLFCTDCTATDGSTGVSQTYSSGTWKNHY